jgi:alpha-L-glutamate ligase-like protein
MIRLIAPSRLHALGILGINRRNARCIAAYNPRRLFPNVDDKLITKQLASAAGIAVPRLYAVVATNRDSRFLAYTLRHFDDFVVKPAHGSGGAGIVVINGRVGAHFRRADGRMVTVEELAHHVRNILSGMYSLGGQPDVAMVEYRVHFDPLFEGITYQGTPDIRTLVYRGFPVMAMIRLPTRQSDGKANLHKGAIGVGVDIASGITTHGVWHSDFAHTHPDTGSVITGLAIPHWHGLLELAARCHELSGLGYLGVDVVLDRELGPLVLELNARPGLAIQLANRSGLCHRLEHIDRHAPFGASPAERTAFAVAAFAGAPA